MDRLFGIRPTPTPQPAPEEESTSKPKYRPKRRPAPAPEPESVPVRKAEPAVKEAASAEEDATKPVDVAPSTEPAPVKPGKGSRKPAPAKPNLAGLDDAAKFKAVKSTALEDAEIKALKIKAETTVDEAEAHTASVEYNKALFRKIRSIEPSLGNYVETVEQAMMKRLSSEKSAQ